MMNTPEYINKEVLLERLDIENALGGHYGISLTEINKIPAADVVEVVRCKDCKMQQYCKVAQYLGNDGFCSNGEKDVRPLRKCKLYKDCEYRTLWNCCCEDCNFMEES